MPPRKKAKASATSTPLQDTQPKTPQDSGAVQPLDDFLNDPWTDEQEIQLFKSMMHSKPTGMHRHFRMIRIHNDMRSNGIATEDAPHTRIPGIWRKLETLYALEDLNTREDEHAFGDERPYIREEAVNIPDFELPEEEYGEMMWQRRFADDSDAPSSPPMFPIEDEKTLYTPGVGLLKDLPGSARYKAETPAEATPTPKNAKTTKGTKAASKSGKGAKAAAANAKNAKARSTVSESAEENDEEDEEEETTPESEEESAPATRRAGRGRVRQPPKRTRKR